MTLWSNGMMRLLHSQYTSSILVRVNFPLIFISYLSTYILNYPNNLLLYLIPPEIFDLGCYGLLFILIYLLLPLSLFLPSLPPLEVGYLFIFSIDLYIFLYLYIIISFSFTLYPLPFTRGELTPFFYILQ